MTNSEKKKLTEHLDKTNEELIERIIELFVKEIDLRRKKLKKKEKTKKSG